MTVSPPRPSTWNTARSRATPAACEATQSASYAKTNTQVTEALLNGRAKYLAKATTAYHSQLAAIRPENDTHGVIAYLTEHCITSETAAEYQLGIVAEPLPGDEQFTGMLAIPYLTRRGTRAIKFRNLKDGPKFLHHAGQKTRLFNVEAYFRADDTIGIAEGEIDAIVATEVLGVPTIGIPGAENWKADIWGPLFKDFARVIVFADGDDAGKRAVTRITETVGWRAVVVQCPDGEDVSSMVAQNRAAELMTRIVKDDESD